MYNFLLYSCIYNRYTESTTTTTQKTTLMPRATKIKCNIGIIIIERKRARDITSRHRTKNKRILNRRQKEKKYVEFSVAECAINGLCLKYSYSFSVCSL